jgi:hypothetical protein
MLSHDPKLLLILAHDGKLEDPRQRQKVLSYVQDQLT